MLKPPKNTQVIAALGVNRAMEEVVRPMRKSKSKVHSLDSLSALLMTFIALSGEFPTDQIGRLPSTNTYKEKIIKSLKSSNLIRTYYRDGLRGLRLTAKAKKLLADKQPDRFLSLFAGDTATSTPKYTILHRLRLHRMAEVLVTMLNAGVSAFPWQKPVVFASSPLCNAPHIECPSYFSSREVKNIGLMGNKIRNSRAVGVLLTDGCVFSVYNTGSSLMKWEYQAEMRFKALLQIELCQNRLPGQFGSAEQRAILFGADMGQVPALLDADSKCRDHFLQDGSYHHFYFLTNDHHGEIVLQLLCDPAEKTALDDILSEGLDPACPGWVVPNDAMDGDDPVLFGYTCDMPRIKRFDNALHIHSKKGTLYCFDFQEDALRELCGPNVSIRVIDFDAYEGSVFHSEEETD